jgi:Zn-dependent M28 family amino/carboxypeptidase
LRFILFGGEEQGLLGSEQQVRRLGQAERQRIIAVVNMDMIGCRNAGPRTVLLEGAPVSQSIIDGLAEAAAAYTSLQVETSLQAANSDHVPFIRANIPAVLTIEGADSTNHRVHTARDTVDTIDYDLLIAILRMNVAFVLNAAGRLP